MPHSITPGFPQPHIDVSSGSIGHLHTPVRAAAEKSTAVRNADLKTASQEFESLFIAYLLKIMRETIEESGLMEESFGKGIYTELFDQELARSLARQGVLGIADLLQKRLTQGEGLAPAASEHRTEPDPVAPAPEPELSDDGSGRGGAQGPEAMISDFHLPVPALVSSNFGLRTDPFTRRIRFHKGVDLAAPEHMEVRAAQGGKVVFAGFGRGYGKTVVIEHAGGFETRYAHLGSVNVRTGEIIGAQQVLGLVGSSGRSTGPHLHFEVIRWGEPIDPRQVLSD